MHVFHTAGVPPSSGRIIFPTIGWTRNRSVALTNSVTPNSFGTDRLRGGGDERNDTCGETGRREMRRSGVGARLRPDSEASSSGRSRGPARVALILGVTVF